MKRREAALLLAAILTATGASCGDDAVAVDAGRADAAADAAAADAPPRALAVESVEDLGQLRRTSAVMVGRDGGYGGVLGGKMLWTFGDTYFDAFNSIDGTNVLSATSAWAPLDDPLSIEEPVDEDGFPAQLIPYRPDEITLNTEDPRNGRALWPGRLIDPADGSGEGVIAFQSVRRHDDGTIAIESVGTARIAVDETVADRAPDALFGLLDGIYLPQLVDGEHVYAFAWDEDDPARGCSLGRARIADFESRDAYEFFDGGDWVEAPNGADAVIDRTGNRPSVSYNAHLGRYLAVNAGIGASTILLRTADAIEGPWSEPVEVEPDDEGYLAPTAAGAANYLVMEHPELAASNGRAIVISYARPMDPFGGEVRLARITLAD